MSGYSDEERQIAVKLVQQYGHDVAASMLNIPHEVVKQWLVESLGQVAQPKPKTTRQSPSTFNPFSAAPIEDDDWETRMACAGMDPRIFQLEENEKKAGEICAGCTVRVPCRIRAIRLEIPGFCGGMSEEDRATYAKKNRLTRANNG